MLKVLFPINNRQISNPYLNHILGDFKEIDYVCSPKLFFLQTIKFDIIHFQWPEAEASA